MDDKSFDILVAKTWRRLTDGIDAMDPDKVEAIVTGDMVTLSFGNGQACVINTQRAIHQVWVAAQGRGIHFNWHDETKTFRDDKGLGLELFAFVADVVAKECGEEPAF